MATHSSILAWEIPRTEEPGGLHGDLGLIPGLGRSPGGGCGHPLQYSCLGNTMDRGVWQGTVHGISKESDMIERLNN